MNNVYSSFNFQNIAINQPIYNNANKCYRSQLLTQDSSDIIIKSSKFKLVNVKNDNLIVEFLPYDNSFYNFINNLDNFIIESIVANGNMIFGTNAKLDTIDELYKKSINLPKSLNCCPTMIFKITNETIICDKYNNPITNDEMSINNEIELCFQLKHIDFKRNNCSTEFIAKKIKITSMMCQNNDIMFDNSDSDPDEITEADIANTVDYN